MPDIFDSISASKGDIFDTVSTQEDIFDKIKGVGEAALSTATGMASWIPSGIVKSAGLVSGQLKEGSELGDYLQEKLTYTPRGAVGKRYAGYVSKPFEMISEGSQRAGDVVYEKTGSPLLGAAVRTAGESIPFVVPYGVVKGVGKVKGSIKSLEGMKGVIPETAKEGYSLKPDVKLDIFDTITQEKANVPKQTVQTETKVEAVAKPEIVEPTATSQVIRDVKPELPPMEGELKPHRTALRVESEAIAQELMGREGLGEDIAKYEVEKGMMDAQAQMGVEIMDKDWDSAVKMAMGEKSAPDGVRPGTMITAVTKRAMEKGDFETIYKLGTTPEAHVVAKEIAKDLKSFDQGLSNNPVTAIQSVMKARKEENARTGQVADKAEITKLSKLLEETQKKLDEHIAKSKVTPPKYGLSNKIVTQAEYLKVKEELRAQFSSQLSAGLDPTIAAKLGKIGAYHLEAGARSFAVWSERVIADVGEWAKPHLEDLWKQANETVKSQEAITLKRFKTRLINEEAKLRAKLEILDFSKQEKRTTVLDAEGHKLKDARDRAKTAYDTAVRKTGTVTKEEAKTLLDLARKAAELKSKYDPNIKTNHGFPSTKDRLEYGKAQVAFERYVASLKEGDQSLSVLAKRRAHEFKTTAKQNPAQAVKDLALDTLSEISDSSIALVASLDNSFIGRQGLVTLQTHPSVWLKGAYKSFGDIYKALRTKHGNDVAKDILHADLVSRENYINGTYQKAGILAKFEEQYPTSHPARIPWLGRGFKASEVAFTNSALRMRMGTFDLLLDMAKKQGLEVNKSLIEDIGSVVNSATARAKMHDSKLVKNLLWAPKMMLANINILTAHGLTANLKTGFARKQAAYNLMKIVGETAAVVAVLNALKPNSVETDPRSSDFLKYRDGNTRIDLTAGRGQYITLAARWLTGQTKNTQTKIIKDLNMGGFGANTYFDVGINFLINKATPIARQVIYITKGKNFEGKKPTILSTITDLTVPIPIGNFTENMFGDYPDKRAIVFLGNLADVFGVNANTYQPLSQWDSSTSKALREYKARVGEERFKQANILYNNRVNKRIEKATKNEKYINFTDEQKKKYIEWIKREEKKRILGS